MTSYSIFVTTLHSMFRRKPPMLDKQTLDRLLSEGKINEQEYDYIVNDSSILYNQELEK